jgi:hypothetical protein
MKGIAKFDQKNYLDIDSSADIPAASLCNADIY